MATHYPAVTCTAERELLDILEAFGAALPITGITDEDSYITFYFRSGTSAEDMIAELRSYLPEGSPVEFAISQVEEQNWNAEFERSLQPVRIAPHLIITQSWNPVSPEHEGDVVVVIDPKMSFGTGHHESTRLISRLLMDCDVVGKNVLDIGTGTGVLSIIAAECGAASVTALDNNEWAVENTGENIALNNIPEGIISLRLGELQDIPSSAVDYILANIHRSVIMELLPEITARMHSGSVLLTSGVLIEDHDSLVEAAEGFGLVYQDDLRENEWVATRFRMN